MRNWLVVLLAVLFLLFPMTIEAWAHGSAMIEGQVVNGTSDGAPLEGLPVTLWIFKGQEQEGSLVETTGGEGRFRFQDLDTEGYTYQLEVEYQSVRYGSDVVAFLQGENALSMALTVYEATTSDAELRVERAHLILDFEPEVILVQEVQIFINGGDTTYVGSTGEEGGATVHFCLPEGASEIQLMEGLMACCVVETETGFASNRPIFPGFEEFVFSYELGYQSPTYTLFKEIAYSIRSLDVLVADVGAEVTAAGLTVEEPLSLEGGRYLHLAGQNLSPADGLTLQFANLPLGTRPAAAPAAGPGALEWVAIGVMTSAVLLALGYPFLKKRREENG